MICTITLVDKGKVYGYEFQQRQIPVGHDHHILTVESWHMIGEKTEKGIIIFIILP
jgi:hypothetical protein